MVEGLETNAQTEMEHTMSNTSIIEQIKEAPEKIAKKFELTKEKSLQLAIYLGVGFLVGFLLKRYSRIVVTVVIVLLALLTLEYFQLIDLTVHWSKVRALIGMQPLPAFNGTFFTAMWESAKDNLAQVMSFSIGFLVGLKLG